MSALAVVPALVALGAWKLAPPGNRLTRATGQIVPDFVLRDVRTGQRHRLSDHESSLVVIVFLGTKWQAAATYLPRLSKFSRGYEKRGAEFVAINSNASESVEEAAEQARAMNVTFPILKDPENRVADSLSAERIGETLVLDRHGRVRYRGTIDDQYDTEAPREEPSRNYLLEAIDALIAGKPVSPETTAVAGPPIERAAGGRSPMESAL